jgi:hypothetical protein
MDRMAFLALSLLLLCATQVSAQQPQRTRGDTLVFKETTRTNGEMQGMQVTGEIGYALFMVHLGGDSAEVWYDSLTFTTNRGTPPGLDVSSFARKKTIAHFRPDGRVTGLEPPGSTGGARAAMTPGFSGVSFALPLPTQPLARGITWTDTTTTKIDTLGVTMTISQVSNYEAVGDSTWEGLPVVVIGLRATIRAQGGGGDMGLETSSEGESTGRLYYSRSLGFVVKRTSQAQVKSNMSAAGMSMQMNNRSETDLYLARRR